MRMGAYPTLLLALMGYMDCLTTVIGIMYFGAVELNPLISGIVSTNLSAFVALKITSTVTVCLIFIQTEKPEYCTEYEQVIEKAMKKGGA